MKYSILTAIAAVSLAAMPLTTSAGHRDHDSQGRTPARYSHCGDCERNYVSHYRVLVGHDRHGHPIFRTMPAPRHVCPHDSHRGHGRGHDHHGHDARRGHGHDAHRGHGHDAHREHGHGHDRRRHHSRHDDVGRILRGLFGAIGR